MEPVLLQHFGKYAEQHWVEVTGARIHMVSAGDGAPLVLMAGWPQSLWAWRHVFPRLTEHYRVYALDLPGMGDSSLPAPAYDGLSVAQTVLTALQQLGLRSYGLICHDIGSWIGYPMGALAPSAVEKLVLMDAVIPGVVPMLPITPQNARMAWHFGFNAIDELPEALTAGRERIFLSWFFRNRSFVKKAITDADLDEYERIYRATGAMTSGFSYYRRMAQSAEQNCTLAQNKLPMPVLVVAGEYGVGARMVDSLLPHCVRGHGVTLANCGHYVPEEASEQLLSLLLEFIDQP